jgi:hypothetical protein
MLNIGMPFFVGGDNSVETQYFVSPFADQHCKSAMQYPQYLPLH